MAAKLQDDCHDAVSLPPLKPRWLEPKRPSPSRHADRLGAPPPPPQRIVCTTMEGMWRLGRSTARHAIFSQMTKRLDDLVRMSRAVETDGEIGRCTLILSGEELLKRKNQEIAGRQSFRSVRAFIQQLLNQEKLLIDRHRRDRVGVLADIDRLSTQFQLTRDRIFSMFKILSRLGYVGPSRETARISGRFKLLKDSSSHSATRSQLANAIARYMSARGRFGRWDKLQVTPHPFFFFTPRIISSRNPSQHYQHFILGLHRNAMLTMSREMADNLGSPFVDIEAGMAALTVDGFVDLTTRKSGILLELKKVISADEIESVARDFQAEDLRDLEEKLASRDAFVQIVTSPRCMMASVADHTGSK